MFRKSDQKWKPHIFFSLIPFTFFLWKESILYHPTVPVWCPWLSRAAPRGCPPAPRPWSTPQTPAPAWRPARTTFGPARRRGKRAESREQRAESREQRAESREQRAESRRQRAEGRSTCSSVILLFISRSESVHLGWGWNISDFDCLAKVTTRTNILIFCLAKLNAVSSPLSLDGQDVNLEEDGDGVELGHVQSLDGVSRHVQDTVFALGRDVLGRIEEYLN